MSKGDALVLQKINNYLRVKNGLSHRIIANKQASCQILPFNRKTII